MGIQPHLHFLVTDEKVGMMIHSIRKETNRNRENEASFVRIKRIFLPNLTVS